MLMGAQSPRLIIPVALARALEALGVLVHDLEHPLVALDEGRYGMRRGDEDRRGLRLRAAADQDRRVRVRPVLGALVGRKPMSSKVHSSSSRRMASSFVPVWM